MPNSTAPAAYTDLPEELEDDLAAAASIIHEARHLARLIEVAGDLIGETWYNDREGALKAFGHGASISATANIVIEKLERAEELLIRMKDQAVAPAPVEASHGH